VRLAYAVAPPARIHYKVTAQARGTTLQGNAQLDWRHDGRTYEALLQVDLQSLPRRTQASSGTLTRDGLAPHRFSERYRTEEAAHFDHAGTRVIFSNNRPDAALLVGAQDRLSAILQLGAMLSASPESFPPGTSIELQTASTREAQTWVFVVQAADPLVLPGGTVETVKLLRMPVGDYDSLVELWLAPGQAYAPVRLRLTQPNGDWVDHQWSSTDRG